MRRIAAVTVTTALLLGGVGLASPANAAGSKRYVSYKGTGILKTAKAYGTYKRSGKSVRVKVCLADTGKNGWSPASQFRVWNGSKWRQSKLHSFSYGPRGNPNNPPADFKFAHCEGSEYSGNAKHLQVRELVVKVSSRKVGKVGAWKKIY